MFPKLFLGATALLLGLAVTGEASAAGPHRHGHGGPVAADRPYYATAGVKFGGGYYYSGRNHNHWGGRVWNTRYNRYHYWDPQVKCYYYWQNSQSCWLPVGYDRPY